MPLNLGAGRIFIIFATLFIVFSSCNSFEEPRVLVFSKTAGFYHASIPDGIQAIQQMGEERGFAVDTTTNAGFFTEENLQQYAAVVFLNTTGDVLNHYEETEFERFIQAGGGFVGIHSAADTEYHWGWYGRLVGGYFSDHPGINDPHPNVQQGILEVADPNHPMTEFLPERWDRTDEWYSYRDMYDEINVLLTIDEESYEGGISMGYHPIAWYHEYDGGRAFYTGLGHTPESYEEDLFLDHLYKGIEYAIGDNRLDYSNARTQSAPEENRFTKTMLSEGEFFEPTEMAILPNKDILIAQRRGEILLYKNDSGSLVQAGMLDVYHETDVERVNAEEGVVGMTADPDFQENNFVYIFYSPADTSVNRLSRFTLINDRLEMESETTVLEFYSQRDICCHTGGSLTFDSDGHLFLSTGDNSTPFNQPNQPHQLDGYAPLDERPGFEQYDARRTSGNTNDLRGKILRIIVNEDGSYDIPEGNLYPVGTEKTRPEIYVQGTRNPYRISVDPKTGDLYWGDVGPDARADSIGVRGSLGYDEINVARGAGHFGWPFFVGDNFPYNEYDYATGTPGEVFDPQNPVNNSPHNTGLRELPPAKPALIWYPYTASEEFPLVETGGRNSMAGPVYYSDLYPGGSGLPEYYDGKLFIYDWIRDWIRVVTLHPDGEYSKMEPFMDQTQFNAIMDMELGPDGNLYILEYGKGWFSRNPDSGLSRIDFNPGNRAPVVHSIHADRTSGLLPFEVIFSVEAEDLEGDPMSYTWEISSGEVIETDEPELHHTFEQIGDYTASVTVQDSEGLSAESESISVYAGNTAPEVHIDIHGNRSFYFPGKNVQYSIRVHDEGPDGISTTIDPGNLFVSADYIEMSEDMDETSGTEGHLVFTEVMSGKNLVSTLGCRACHHQVNPSVGPSYQEIADRYKDENDSASFIADRIISGSSGIWGDVAMPAHSDMAEEDAYRIVAWIESLSEEEDLPESLPAEGSLDPTLGEDTLDNGLLLITATYSDGGTERVKPLSGNASVNLRNSRMGVSSARNLDNYNNMEFGGTQLLLVPNGPGSFSLNGIHLESINEIELISGSQEAVEYGYHFEIRLGSPEGEIIGEGTARPDTRSPEGFFADNVGISIQEISDDNYHDIYFVSRPADERESGTIILTGVEFKAGN
ncbi:PKD domain-containing protein [Rhodohalobacter sp. SW132]|uniref:ThuA domain-containing protein n=1 Tax=Rhodohalobacter sp. SW132 TaxID=2293433 RepID=UPI000E26E292|nr:ThuA domain-containing protein [Rhodohalobacter sp. SW132]REL37859.1 PKD domain-containing protein [Rhodohalobacter sp. SW132]